MRKILVLRGGALGDFLVTLPALARLRQRWPAARLALAGNPTAAVLGCRCGLLDSVHSQHEARWSALFGRASLPRGFAAWLAEFDLVVNFWPDPQGALQAHFPLRPEQIFLCAAAQPVCAPASAHYCEPLRALGIEPGESWCRLGWPKPDARLIALHPGSGSPSKNWPIERWLALATWLVHERHAELLVVTGEAEAGAAHALARFGATARNLPLTELAARLADCRLFIGHDSGVSHLSAASGVPGVLLFGPTDPAIWAPPAPHVRVLRPGIELAAVSVASVQREIMALEAAAGFPAGASGPN